MFNLTMLDTAIGLALVFCALSLAVTAANEAIEAFVRARAAKLRQGICEMLDEANGPDFVARFFDHPLIYGLYRGGSDANPNIKFPSYIPSRNFSLAMLDLLGGPPPPGAATAPSEKVKRVFEVAIRAGNRDPERVRLELEAWYDSAMDRVSGWYRRRTQGIVIGLGLAVAILGNVNAIVIFQSLQSNAAIRASLLKVAEDPARQGQSANAAIEAVASSGLSIGWTGSGLEAVKNRVSKPKGLEAFAAWVELVGGYVLTGLALSLGAPFWFDVLNRLMVIRSTVKPHEKSREEASEDPQDNSPPRRAGSISPATATAGGPEMWNMTLTGQSRTDEQRPAAPP